MSDFKNILDEMAQVRDIVFMTKSWKPVKAYNNGHKMTVNEIRPLVLKSARVLQVIEKLSKKKEVSQNEFITKVRAFLDEMGHKKNMTVIRWVGLALCKLLRKNYLGIMVDEESIMRAKSVMGTNPVIFAPSHRSYGDFILMSFLCYYYDIEIPSVAAGMDFKGMWGIGDVLRDCGAFFIKRTFGGDDLYKATFHEYITTLVANGESAVEFFIEGTRSRTGKSLVPKFGLLTAALEQYFIGKVPDITIIPVSITYERVLEEKLFANELLGVPKPKESTRLLFKALKILNNNYGQVFVKFGAPISVHEYCVDFVSEDPRVRINQFSLPFHESLVKPNTEKIISNLGYEIVYAQNDGMQYTSIHKFAASLSAGILYSSDVPVSCIMDDMAAIGSVLNHSRNGEKEDVTLSEVVYCISMHQDFIIYDKENETVRLRKYSELAPNAEESSLKGYKLSPSIVEQVFPVMVLQQYANSVCLKCCHVSILTILAYTADDDFVRKEYLLQDYIGVRTLFRSEFALKSSKTSREKDYDEAVSKLKNFGLLKENNEDSDTFLINKAEPGSFSQIREMVLMSIFFPFLQGYSMTLKQCYKKGLEQTRINQKQFLKEIQHSIETSMPESTIHGYTLSTDLLTNAINSYIALGLVTKIRTTTGDIDLCVDLEECDPVIKVLDSLVSHLWEILEDGRKNFPGNPKKKCNL